MASLRDIASVNNRGRKSDPGMAIRMIFVSQSKKRPDSSGSKEVSRYDVEAPALMPNEHRHLRAPSCVTFFLC